MVHQHVAFFDYIENIVGTVELRHGRRRIFRRTQLVKALQSVYLHQKSQVKRSVDFKNVLLTHGKLAAQNL